MALLTNFQAEARVLVIELLESANHLLTNLYSPYAATLSHGPLAQHEERNNLLKTSNETSLSISFPLSLSADLTTTEPRRKFGVAKG